MVYSVQIILNILKRDEHAENTKGKYAWTAARKEAKDSHTETGNGEVFISSLVIHFLAMKRGIAIPPSEHSRT